MGMECADHPMGCQQALRTQNKPFQSLILCLACGELISSTEGRLEVEFFSSTRKLEYTWETSGRGEWRNGSWVCILPTPYRGSPWILTYRLSLTPFPHLARINPAWGGRIRLVFLGLETYIWSWPWFQVLSTLPKPRIVNTYRPAQSTMTSVRPLPYRGGLPESMFILHNLYFHGHN